MDRFEATIRSAKAYLRLESSSRTVGLLRPCYDWLLSLTYGRRGLTRVINGQEAIRVRPAHRYVEERYETAVFNYLMTTIRPGSTVLEIGAHVGLFTVVLARWVRPAGRV